MTWLLLALLACGDKDTDTAGAAVGEDADGDGWSAAEDCDDNDAGLNPGAVEVCDGLDDDCDEAIDEGLGATYYLDSDGDGFGDPAGEILSCTQPAGYTTNSADCDDDNSEIYAGAEELCDDLDGDCDGTVDEGFEGVVWYRDGDGDGYGVDDDTRESCAAPDGYAAEPGDCDDSEPGVYPGAWEFDDDDQGDGVDNDCDEAIDEGLPFGDGGDGPLTVTGEQTFDPGCTRALSISGAVIAVEDASAFSPGDMALLINKQGSPGATERVGTWAQVNVAAVGAGEVTLSTPPAAQFDQLGDGALEYEDVALQRIPQYSEVTVAGALIAAPFDGACGGVIAFTSAGVLRVDGAIDAAGAGYAGGMRNELVDRTGFCGEGTQGPSYATSNANGSGGGGGGEETGNCDNCEGSGGGGGHSAPGEDGDPGNTSLGAGGTGGGACGAPDLTVICMGGGGGAGAVDDASELGEGGGGGDGGGIIWLRARSLSVTGLIDASGTDGEPGCGQLSKDPGCVPGNQSEAGAGGGGAGGAIFIAARELSLAPASVLAIGGGGRTCGSTDLDTGGVGADGRIRLDFDTIDGEGRGTGAASALVSEALSPEPSYSTSP